MVPARTSISERLHRLAKAISSASKALSVARASATRRHLELGGRSLSFMLPSPISGMLREEPESKLLPFHEAMLASRYLSRCGMW
jgi:hypothetical protein